MKKISNEFGEAELLHFEFLGKRYMQTLAKTPINKRSLQESFKQYNRCLRIINNKQENILFIDNSLQNQWKKNQVQLEFDKDNLSQIQLLLGDEFVNEAKDKFLLGRTSFFVKIWEGIEITAKEVSNNPPGFLFFCQNLLKLKFKREFSPNIYEFQVQLETLRKHFFKKRQEKYLIFLLGIFFKHFRKKHEISKSQMFSKFFEEFFQGQQKRYSFFFHQCNQSGIIIKRKGLLLKSFLQKNEKFKQELTSLYETVIER